MATSRPASATLASASNPLHFTTTEENQTPLSLTSHEAESIFAWNSDYVLLQRYCVALHAQLHKSRNELERLHELKTKATTFPEEVLEALKTKENTWLSEVPRRRILRFPALDLSRWQQRISRRSNTPYEQNCEFLVAKLNQIQYKQMFSELKPGHSIVAEALSPPTTPVSRKRSFAHIREQFMASLNPKKVIGNIVDIAVQIPRSQTAPPTVVVKATSSTTPATPLQLHQPKPKMAVHSPSSLFAAFDSGPTTPRLPTPISIASSSCITSPCNHSRPDPPQFHAKPRIRRYASTTPEQTSLTHNVPWSDDEKRKLEYLMGIYPEEDIMARRFAKIAAALGTRTANQVASRIQKLQAKEQRKQRPSFTPMINDDKSQGLLTELEAFFADRPDKDSAEYQEYLRIKSQMLAIKQNPINGIVHNGFCCDCCKTDPIIGSRWVCTSCPASSPAIDLCAQCVSRGFETAVHKMNHIMKKIEVLDFEDSTFV